MTEYHCRTNIELGRLLFQRHTTPTLTRSTQRQGAKAQNRKKVGKKVIPVCEGGLRVCRGHYSLVQYTFRWPFQRLQIGRAYDMLVPTELHFRKQTQLHFSARASEEGTCDTHPTHGGLFQVRDVTSSCTNGSICHAFQKLLPGLDSHLSSTRGCTCNGSGVQVVHGEYCNQPREHHACIYPAGHQ